MSSDLAIERALWLNAVDELQVQNNYLKEGLLSMLQQSLSPVMLNRLENVQTQLLDKDAAMALLRYDIAALVRDRRSGAAGMPARLLRLGRDINSMEDDIKRMKTQLDALRKEIEGSEVQGSG
jgi:hypothetical protein